MTPSLAHSDAGRARTDKVVLNTTVLAVREGRGRGRSTPVERGHLGHERHQGRRRATLRHGPPAEVLGLSEEDIVVRVSSRKVLEQVLGDLGIEGDEFTETCVIIDKWTRSQRRRSRRCSRRQASMRKRQGGYCR